MELTHFEAQRMLYETLELSGHHVTISRPLDIPPNAVVENCEFVITSQYEAWLRERDLKSLSARIDRDMVREAEIDHLRALGVSFEDDSN